MSLVVKICGLTTPEAVDAVIAGRAAYAGFVFFPASPRALSLDAARPLRERLPGTVKAVALTVDASDAELARIAETIRPDLFQLHGAETPARAAEIRARFGRPIIKAIPLAGPEDLNATHLFSSVADLLLFDAKPLPADTRPGGNARRFDWSLLSGFTAKIPWLLAGGLDPANLATAVKLSGARMVDVSSGVERRPGQKDPGLIEAFLAAARAL